MVTGSSLPKQITGEFKPNRNGEILWMNVKSKKRWKYTIILGDPGVADSRIDIQDTYSNSVILIG